MTKAARDRVLVVARMSPRRNTRTRRLIRLLQQTHDVEVICEALPGSDGQTTRLDGAVVREVRLPLAHRRLGRLAGLLRVVWFNLIATREGLSGNYSAVVCADGLYALAGIAGRVLRAQALIFDSYEMSWALGLGRVMSLFLGWTERIALTSADLWLVPSRERAELMLAYHAVSRPYVVIANLPLDALAQADEGVSNAPPPEAAEAGSPITVMFQGSVTARRGLEELLLAAREREFDLIIQGDGDRVGWLQERASENVTFLPPCENTQAIAFLRRATLSFVTYENDCLNSAWACSSKLLVAILAGVPALCNDLPAFRAFSGEYGGIRIFERLNAESIREAIRSLARSPGVMEELRRQASEASSRLLAEAARNEALLVSALGTLIGSGAGDLA